MHRPDAAFDRRAGWLVVVVGAALTLAVQIAAPIGVPLFDGVVVQEPYRYLHPTGDQPGSPTSFESTPAVSDGVSPLFAAATTESPAQAQLIASRDAFRLTAGATALNVSITAVEPGAPPDAGAIAGNVYRFSVTDQSGTPLAVNDDCADCLNLVLRAPEDALEATVGRFADGAWTPVPAEHAGIFGSYALGPTALGDYAIFTTTEAPEAGFDPLLVVSGGALVVLVIVGAFLFFRVPSTPARKAPRDDAAGARVANRVASKRRRPPKPPAGRSS